MIEISNCEELIEYAQLEGCELGNYCNDLANLFEIHSVDKGMSKTFEIALNKEILFQLNKFKENSKIVETEKEEKHLVKIRELIWNDE